MSITIGFALGSGRDDDGGLPDRDDGFCVHATGLVRVRGDDHVFMCRCEQPRMTIPVVGDPVIN